MDCNKCKQPIETYRRNGLYFARCECGKSRGYVTEYGALQGVRGNRKRTKRKGA